MLAPGVSLALYYSFGAQVSVVVSACFFALAFVCSRFVKTPDELAAEQAAARGGEAFGQSANEPSGKSARPKFSLKTFIEQRSVLPACIMFFVTACYGAMTSFVPVMSEFRGISGVQWFFVVEALAVVASRPFMGKFVDTHGYRPAGAAGYVVMCRVFACLPLLALLILFLSADKVRAREQDRK